MGRVVKTVLSFLCCAVLCFAIFLEGRFIMNEYASRVADRHNALVKIANTKAQVSIDKIYEYPEIVLESESQEVFNIDGLLQNVKVSGVIADTTDSYAGTYAYTDADSTTHKLQVMEKLTDIAPFQEGILDYWNAGDYTKLLNAIGNPWQPESINCFQQTFKGDKVVIIQNTASDSYYMVLDADTSVFILASDLPFLLSDEIATVHFADPAKEYLLAHNYSMYEVTAAENTQYEILDKLINGEDEGTFVQAPSYNSTPVTGTSGSYTSAADDNIRKQMVSYADHVWNSDGKSDTTTLMLDITSAEAMKSEWVFTATTFSYTRAGLTVSNVHANVSADSVEITCNINNTLNTQRPYVVVLKFIDKNDKLAGYQVLDNRGTPLTSNGVAALSATIYRKDLTCDGTDVKGVMFEVY